MNVILIIDGREAIPIRALPYVTGWTMSPDVVAKTFAHADHWTTKLMNMHAFHFSNHNYAAMLPKEWDGVLADLVSLSNMLQMDEELEGGNYSAWRRDSIPLLPPACFMWKDEFEKAFKQAYSKEKLFLMDERVGDRDLNFSPLVPETLQDKVMQGFDLPKVSDVKTSMEKSLSTKERETALKLIIGMAVAGYKYDPKAPRNSATTEITADLEKLGLGLDQDTVRNWLKEASWLLPPKPIGT